MTFTPAFDVVSSLAYALDNVFAALSSAFGFHDFGISHAARHLDSPHCRGCACAAGALRGMEAGKARGT
jgi:hypothetical protein